MTSNKYLTTFRFTKLFCELQAKQIELSLLQKASTSIICNVTVQYCSKTDYKISIFFHSQTIHLDVSY